MSASPRSGASSPRIEIHRETVPASSQHTAHVNNEDRSPEATSSFLSTSGVLSRFDYLGFDLDHTLVRYQLSTFTPWLFRIIASHVVKFSHYPEWILQTEFEFSAMHKALVWDSYLGHMLKLDAQKRVVVASHGWPHRMLSEAEIARDYPNPISSFDGGKHERWHPFYTYFEMPSVQLVSMMVECTDKGEVPVPAAAAPGTVPSAQTSKYRNIFPQLSAAFEYHLGASDRGDYFPAFHENPGQFLLKRDDVAQWLKDLRAQGKFLFLATNSRMDYTELLATYSFGPAWRDLFDLIIVDCKKPGWFMKDGLKLPGPPTADGQPPAHQARPFYFVDPITLKADLNRKATLDDLSKKHGVFVHGNAHDLTALFEKLEREKQASHLPPHVIYFGDHIHTDCVATRQFTNWSAGAIVEEVEPLHHLGGGKAAFDPYLTPSASPTPVGATSPPMSSPLASSITSPKQPNTPPPVHSVSPGVGGFSASSSTASFAAAAAAAADHNPNNFNLVSATKNVQLGPVPRRNPKHRTFHELQNQMLHDLAPPSPKAVFGSFFFHMSGNSSSSSSTKANSLSPPGNDMPVHRREGSKTETCCVPPMPASPDSSATAATSSATNDNIDIGVGGALTPAWSYWYHVLSQQCEVVVGCLSDFNEMDACCVSDGYGPIEDASAASSVAASASASAISGTGDAAATAAVPSLLPPTIVASTASATYSMPKLNPTCVQAPIYISFTPPPLGSGFCSSTPASILESSAAAQKMKGIEDYKAKQVIMQYSIHKVPATMKAELRPVFPELSKRKPAGEAVPVEEKMDSPVSGAPTAAAVASAAAITPASMAAPSATLSLQEFKSLTLYAVPTFQRTDMQMIYYTPEVEAEKNRLLESFYAFSNKICENLRALGHWADLSDPCTGYPAIGPHGSSIYSEMDSAQILLTYRMEQVGSCCLIVHPFWNLSQFPATFLTDAPLDVLQRAIAEVEAGLSAKKLN